ncbi:MAG: competence/damage-inducible protein A [Francisellaceae bacterium]|jgi:nicotinamide-nucleotide amidase|nr:competence/damage-inducible protein A [Francisellaceae bacterium]
MPKIEIVAIGNEVLQGAVLNSNAAFIAQQFNKIGLEVNSHVVVGDDLTEIKEVLLFSIDHFDLTIVTGGLGSTCDDITKKVLIEIYETKLKINADVLESLQKRYPNMRTNDLENQAAVPKEAIILYNDIGTAPGLLLKSKDNLLFSLPGVPKEVEYLTKTALISIIKENFNTEASVKYYNLHFAKLPETDINENIEYITTRYPQIQIGIYPHYGVLTIHLRLKSTPSKFEIHCLDDAAKYLISQHQDNFFSDHSYDLPELISEICLKHQITISLTQDLINLPIGYKISSIPSEENVVIADMTLSHDALIKRFRLDKVSSLKDAAIFIAKNSKSRFESNISISIVHHTKNDHTKEIMYCFYLETGKHTMHQIPSRLQPNSKVRRSIISNYILADLLKFLRLHMGS